MEDLTCIPGLLLPWFRENARPLPWRENRDPYRVWLSEIMLQQTRVEAATGYYARFLAVLPDIPSLAAAPEEQLLKLWEGLGYYTRVRNLQKAARRIVEIHGGVFPSDYREIRALPGVGPYTAGAVGSICFDLPTPAVDGNVLRVWSRFTACAENVDLPAVKKKAEAALRPLYAPGICGALTQGLMELGACVCVPNGAPRCGVCPLAARCAANLAGTQTRYPVRGEKKARKTVTKLVLIPRCGDRTGIRKRPSKGLLAGLWEFPNLDVPAGAPDANAAADFARSLGLAPLELVRQRGYTHVFTHVEWEMTGFYFTCARTPDCLTWVTREELETAYALPSAFRPFDGDGER